MLGLLKKVFESDKRRLTRLSRVAKQVDSLGADMEKFSDDELRGKTEEFKLRYQKGETLDDLLVEAFAVVREGSRRVFQKYPYMVQIMGGVVLHDGDIPEMKTGEGKTLTATMPVYLNALSGEGVHVITVNEYLAHRDASEMGELYKFLGLTVGLNLNSMEREEKQVAYRADITYGTNNEFGFDYLRDNMVLYKEDMVQRPLNFAVVDEVDSILVDEARTPLIIAGTADKSPRLYTQANGFVRTLNKEKDYTYDEKTKAVQLTEDGMTKAERAFGIDNLFDVANVTLNHHINQALRAHVVMLRDIDYVVADRKVVIVDPFTGRLMAGRRYSEGLHQAIEAKEGLEIENDSMTLATITFQNYFRMYKKLSGMTGTAKTEEEEFRNIYNMGIISIPTNKPIERKDFPDLIYKSMEGKFRAAVDDIAERHKKGQPVLVGTVAVETSEIISKLLQKKGVPHNILNAKNHEKEAEIIINAGQSGAVTIATNMAGRGTDIKLGEGVIELGGLTVIGTERHESRRIDNQLRGRAGRQGDPGETQFYLSLEDELMRRFGSENMMSLMEKMGMDDSQPIQSKMVSKAVESAQKRVEGNNYDARKQLLQYDDVLREQREIMYRQRGDVLDAENLRPVVEGMIRSSIERCVYNYTVSDLEEEWDLQAIITHGVNNLFAEEDLSVSDLKGKDAEEIIELIWEEVQVYYNEREEEFTFEQMREFERVIVLRIVDTKWMEHIDTMDQLRQGIHLRAYGQIDPLREYRMEGFEMFEAMISSIEDEITLHIMKAQLQQNLEREEVMHGEAVNPAGEEIKKKPKKVKTIGRNEECPCGSGKKYKHCCGRIS